MARFTDLLRSLFSSYIPAQRRKSRQRPKQRRPRLELEWLEDRLAPAVFSNTTSIMLDDPDNQSNGNNNAIAAPYPSNINVSGLTGTISNVNVTLSNATYSFSQDIDALLVGPSGQTLILVADLGPNGGPSAGANNSTLTLSDAGTLPTMTTPWGSASTFKPVNFGGFNEVWESPAPAGPYGDPGTAGTGATLGSVFDGADPNGTWSLYVITTSGGDGTGAIAGGWSLDVTTANLTGTSTTVSSSNNPSFTAAPNNSVTFTADVTSTSTVDSGTVTFKDNGVALTGGAAVPVSASGVATFTTSFTTEGDHNITAVYNGTASFATSTSNTLDQVVNNHTTVNGNVFSNTGSIALNDPDSQSNGNNNAIAGPYPSNIFVSGLTGTISDVTVQLSNVSYSFSQDIDALLVGPGGQTLILVADLGPNGGASAGANNSTLTLSDAGTLPTMNTPWGSSSTFKPVNFGGFNEVWESPAPAGPYGDPGTAGTGATLGSVFDGADPNGTWSLYVITTSGGDGTGAIAGGWSLTITAPPLTLTSISPNSTTAGSGDTMITLNGSNFIDTSTAEFNGSPLATSFVNSGQLTAIIPAADLTMPTTASITVVDPGPGGAAPPALCRPFTISSANNPVPTLTNISPSSATAGSGDTMITLTGTNFVSTSTADFNGVAIATTFVNAMQLTAIIPAADFGTEPVTVVNPTPGGGTSYPRPSPSTTPCRR